MFPTNSSRLPAASSRPLRRSGSSRRLSLDAGAGRERRLSECVWVSWRKGRGGAGCPGTHRYLSPDSKERQGPSVWAGKGNDDTSANSDWTVQVGCHRVWTCFSTTGRLIRNSVNSVNRPILLQSVTKWCCSLDVIIMVMINCVLYICPKNRLLFLLYY